MPQLYIGTSGFTLQRFYPPELPAGEKLRYYQSVFPSVEINSTFYHMPLDKTLIKWHASVSPKFIYTFKVPKLITHLKDQLFDANYLLLFLQKFTSFQKASDQPASLYHLFLFQFPASKKHNVSELIQLLTLLPKGFRYAFEFRQSSWFEEKVIRAIIDHKSTIVISHGPVNQQNIPLWPYFDQPVFPFTYVRYHGSPQLYYSSYTADQLKSSAQYIQKRFAEGKDVYAYFNNDAMGHASENAQQLQQLFA